MGVDTYWRYQRAFDTIIALTIAIIINILWRYKFFIFEFNAQDIFDVAKESFGISSSLFGLVAATVSFVFSAIDTEKFRILRESDSRKQMWIIFSYTLICLFVSSAWSFLLMLKGNQYVVSQFYTIIGSFIIMLVGILLARFTWVMTQIIAVKAS